VIQWNRIALRTSAAAPFDPPREARALALVHAAVLNAVNAIRHAYPRTVWPPPPRPRTPRLRRPLPPRRTTPWPAFTLPSTHRWIPKAISSPGWRAPPE
jgi:hypothetical protein